MSDLRDQLGFHFVHLNDDTWEARDSQGNSYYRAEQRCEVENWADGFKTGADRALEEVDRLRGLIVEWYEADAADYGEDRAKHFRYLKALRALRAEVTR